MEDNYLPLFPLNIVAFPGEKINLHIFEPRYRQLIHDCRHDKHPFGIPSYIHSKIEYGTEVELVEITKVYPDGRMDVRCRGKRIFEVVRFDNPSSGKLYAGGIVGFLSDQPDAQKETTRKMIRLASELYEAMEVVKEVSIAPDVSSYDLGHKIGLSQEQEYELIQIESEEERQQYIILHLEKAIPMLKNVERTKERIKMNGHFRSFDPLNF